VATVDDAVLRLTNTSVGELEQKLALSEALEDPFVAEFSNHDLVLLAGCSLDEHPSKSNWVEKVGGLPEYICEVARGIKRSGKSTSNAIQIAIGTIQRWARGQGDVNADTRAKAAAALAEWEKKRAQAKAS
jgi:hypothetical protein